MEQYELRVSTLDVLLACALANHDGVRIDLTRLSIDYPVRARRPSQSCYVLEDSCTAT